MAETLSNFFSSLGGKIFSTLVVGLLSAAFGSIVALKISSSTSIQKDQFQDQQIANLAEIAKSHEARLQAIEVSRYTSDDADNLKELLVAQMASQKAAMEVINNRLTDLSREIRELR